MTAKPDVPFLGPDSHPRKARRVAVTPGSCDSHAHVVGPHSRYPRAGGRQGVVPPEALLEDYKHMLSALGIERAVLVQPSVYGTDNTALLDAIATAPDRMRGIAVVDSDVSDAELARLRKGGVKGVRFNTRGSGPLSAGKRGPVTMDTVLRSGERLRRLGWHAQFLMVIDSFPDVDRQLRDYPVDIVIDHMGYLDPARGLDSPGFQTLLRLLRTGRCWVKLSAPYRYSKQDAPYGDIAPFARKLLETAPDRVLWASDWPHSAVLRPGSGDTRRMPNDGELLDLLADWVPDEGLRRKILVDNPTRLYGFA